MWLFDDRQDAGARLGEALRAHGVRDAVVLGLPRGGVPVAARVARALGAPLDVLVVRKVGAPGHPEFAVGAVAADATIMDHGTASFLGLTPGRFARLAAPERMAVAEREARYRAAGPAVPIAGRTVVLVDDGLATGATAEAAVAAARARGARRVILAAPVASHEAVRRLRAVADEVVVLAVPEAFHAVGEWYAEFGQVGDAEVEALLAGLSASRGAG